ncbi:hypothetical protein Tco_0390514 [Tanacetum coccineum]
MEKAATTASSLEAEQDSGNINRTQSMTTLNESFTQGTGSGSGPRNLCFLPKSFYSNHVPDEALLYMSEVRHRGAATTVTSLDAGSAELEQERLGYEEGLRLKAEIDEEERQRITRVQEEASSFNIEEWDDIQARVEADEEYIDLQSRKNLFEITMRRVHTFVLMESKSERVIPELAAGTFKRDAEEELVQESSKRLKTGESSVPAEEPNDKEEEELSQERIQQMMIIVPEQ